MTAHIAVHNYISKPTNNTLDIVGDPRLDPLEQLHQLPIHPSLHPLSVLTPNIRTRLTNLTGIEPLPMGFRSPSRRRMHNRPRASFGRAPQNPRVDADEGGRGELVVPEERRTAETWREGVHNDIPFARGGVGEVLSELAHDEDLQEL